MSQTIKLTERILTLFDKNKKFIALGSTYLEDQHFIENVLKPKIKKDVKYLSKDFWATLGFSNDNPIDWQGQLEFSEIGNEYPTEIAVIDEIKVIKQLFPEAAKSKIIERFIDFRNIVFKFPKEFTCDEIPELRLTLMLKDTQGALVFYDYTDNNSETAIEYILPQATEEFKIIGRDRLNYFFKALPDFKYEETSNGLLTLSPEKVFEPFKIKILIFERGQFHNNDQLIKNLQLSVNNNISVIRKPKFLVYCPQINDFIEASPSNVSTDKKTLFLIHGTFGSTESSFKFLYKESDWLNNLLTNKVYEQIVAFDHPTVFYNAKDNIDALFEIFEELKIQPFKQEVDFIGTSQGGLLVQYLANLKNPYIKVGKAALVASANGVGYLTTAQHISTFLSIMKFILKKSGNGEAYLIVLLAQLSVDYIRNLPGLDQMNPKSQSLIDIMSGTPVGNTCYLPVIDDFEPKDIDDFIKRFLARGLDVIIRQILGHYNDWVVGTAEQYIVPSKYCAIPDYNQSDFENKIKESLHGHCLDREDAKNEICAFFSSLGINKCPNSQDYVKKTSFPASNTFLERVFASKSDENIKYDAHFHLLSLEMLMPRLIVLLNEYFDDKFFTDENNHQNIENIQQSNGKPDPIEMIKLFFEHPTCKSTYDDLKNRYRRIDTSYGKYMPLMMDIEYIFNENYSDDNGVVEKIKEKIQKFESIRNVIKEMLENKDKKIKDEHRNVLKRFIEGTEHLGDYQNKSVIKSHYTKLKSGYYSQLDAFVKLKDDNQSEFFPFLAVDPRRDDMQDLIDLHVIKNKTFKGLKIYPPMGYSPADPFLMKNIYPLCIENNIPVVTHCSAGGFCTFVKNLEVIGWVMPDTEINSQPIYFDGITKISFRKATEIPEKAYILNHPKLWEKVLEQFPILKINFAHFGGEDTYFSWDTDKTRDLSKERRNEIYDLMKKYPNVYTDISCVMEISTVQNIYNNYYNNPAFSELKKKFMYGSDFFLNLLWGQSFDEYYNKFVKIISKEDFNQISVINPATFLEIKNFSPELKNMN